MYLTFTEDVFGVSSLYQTVTGSNRKLCFCVSAINVQYHVFERFEAFVSI